MIHGLKVAFTGEEIIRAIDGRIEEHHASIQFKRDEIDGKVEHKRDVQWQVPVEEVEQEIRVLQHRIQTLMMYRDRIQPTEAYLLGKRALRLANLMPRPRAPTTVEFDEEKEIRWVTRSA